MMDTVELVIGLVIVLGLTIGTWVEAHNTVATECERLGAFYVGNKVYECKLKELK